MGRARHISGDTASRFWPKVDRRGVDECWPWVAGLDRHGYGVLGFGSKPHRAHRVAWELTFGPIPPGICVLHRCDNPPCVNPGHLWLGTQAENMRDASRKGRIVAISRPGENARTAKIAGATVVEIRARCAAGATLADEGRRVGLTTGAIWRIVHRKTWRHI